MMKICFVSTSSATYGLLAGNAMARVGGAELQQSLIAKCLRRCGYEVSFLVHDMGQPDIVVNDEGIKLIKTFGLRRSSPLLRYIKPLRLLRGLELADADVYYQRASGFITGLVAAYCKLKRRKFIFAVALDWDVDGKKERSFNSAEAALYRFGIRNTDAVLVQTEHQERMLRQHFGRTGVLIRNIYQMPDVADGTRDIVLWVANFYPVKRPMMLAKVAARMPEYKFVMVGRRIGSDPQVYDDVVAAAKELPNLEVHAPVPYAEVGSLYSRALAFVNTSEVEGFPNSFLDALSRRVPLVATFDPDGMISRYDLGYHCNTVDEMVAGLNKLLSDPSLCARLGENGYRYVKEKHDIAVVKPEYERLLEGLRVMGDVKHG